MCSVACDVNRRIPCPRLHFFRGALVGALFLGGLFAWPSEASAQHEDISFETAMPPEFNCLPASSCRFEAGRLRVDVGATFRYDATNLAAMSYAFASATPGLTPQVAVATKRSTCAGTEAPVSASLNPVPAGVALSYDAFGAVCVLFTVTPGSPSAVLLSGVGVRRMSPEEVNSKIMLAQVQANMIDPLRAEILTGSANAVVLRLETLRTGIRREMDLAATRFERSRDINFEASLALAVGDVNQTANPLAYQRFNDLMANLNQELSQDPVGQAYLTTLRQDLENPPNRLRSILGAGATIVQGLIGSTSFGTVANGLRALFASTFSTPSVANRAGQSGVTAPTPKPANEAVRFGDLAGLAVQLTSGSQGAVSQKLNTGAARFRQLDSLLNTLERANNDVNIITDRLSEVSSLSAANESGFLSTFENLLRRVNVNCEPTRCRQLALMLRVPTTRDSVLNLVDTYIQTEIAKVRAMNGDQVLQYSLSLGGVENDLGQLPSSGRTRYDLMVSTYRSFFETLRNYVGVENNPFGRQTVPCTGVAQSTPGCQWQTLATRARERINGIYPSKFNEKYVF